MTTRWRAMAASGLDSAANAGLPRARACASSSRQSNRWRGWSILNSRRTETAYGLHTVGALLQRHPERVLRVWLQQGREDSRAVHIEQLARAAGKPTERIAAERLA